MDVTAVVLITAAMFGWCLLSARLERANLTAPMVFIAVGAALAGLGLVDGPSAPETVTPLLEITLVWVLFSDAARLPAQQLRRDLGRYVRLLGVGLPLTIAFGCALAAWFFPLRRTSPASPFWRWHCSPTPPPWRWVATVSLPPSVGVWRSVRAPVAAAPRS